MPSQWELSELRTCCFQFINDAIGGSDAVGRDISPDFFQLSRRLRMQAKRTHRDLSGAFTTLPELRESGRAVYGFYPAILDFAKPFFEHRS